jgi:hypothetical protein
LWSGVGIGAGVGVGVGWIKLYPNQPEFPIREKKGEIREIRRQLYAVTAVLPTVL